MIQVYMGTASLAYRQSSSPTVMPAEAGDGVPCFQPPPPPLDKGGQEITKSALLASKVSFSILSLSKSYTFSSFFEGTASLIYRQASSLRVFHSNVIPSLVNNPRSGKMKLNNSLTSSGSE